jgi:hypothetical protein
MRQTVTVAPFSAPSATGWHGADVYGAAVSYPARVEWKQRRIVAEDGHEKLSTGRVFLDGDVSVSVRDRLTLPAGASPTQPPILSVGKAVDHLGAAAATIIYF